MNDEQFTALLEAADPEVFHAFALAVWDAAWSDASGTAPQIVAGDRLARFMAQVALEHGSALATRQARAVPGWLKDLQGR